MDISLIFIVLGTLLTGAANSLLTKYQDNQCVRNCEDTGSSPQYFNQPAIQTLQMFLGELAMFSFTWGINGTTQGRIFN